MHGRKGKSVEEWCSALEQAAMHGEDEPRPRAFCPWKNASVWMAFEWALVEATGRPVMLADDAALVERHAEDLEHVGVILAGPLLTTLLALDPHPDPSELVLDTETNLESLAWRVRTTATSPKMLLQSTLVVADEDELVTTLRSGALPSTVSARCLAAAEDGPTIAVATSLSFPAMKGAGESDSPSSLWGQLTALLGPREAVANRDWTTMSDDDRRLGRSLLE